VVNDFLSERKCDIAKKDIMVAEGATIIRDNFSASNVANTLRVRCCTKKIREIRAIRCSVLFAGFGAGVEVYWGAKIGFREIEFWRGCVRWVIQLYLCR